MGWLVVTLETDAARADAWSDALLACGALSVEVTDAFAGTDTEQALFAEPGEAAMQSWAQQRLAALFDDGAHVQDALRKAGQIVASAPPSVVTVTRVADQDWVRATQDQFTPIAISPRLWIVPTWHQPADPGAINLILDPGMAFGTGSHATTRLCLRWLDQHLKGGESVMDYGCGSGVLAIAAARLGARHVTGVDIDPYAIIASRANAVQNQVMGDFLLADQLTTRTFDVVLANILANPLRVLAPLLCALANPGGHLVLSGILSGQEAELVAIYRQRLEIVEVEHEDGWARIVAQRADR